MIRDKLATFAAAGSIVAGTGTLIVGDVYDTAARAPTAVSGIFDSDDLFLVIRPSTTIVASGGAGTLEFQFVSAATATISSSPNIHFRSRSMAINTTAAVGTGLTTSDVTVCTQVPRGSGVIPIYLRYIGILAVSATQAVTTGAVNAFLTKDAGFWAALPQATQ